MTKAAVKAAAAPQPTPAPVPQPTHGGVYQLVDGKLEVLEGGPPKADEAAAAPAQPQGEGA
jgi:hypothetical protein